MKVIGYLSPDEVVDSDSFAQFVQQTCGTPAPSLADIRALQSALKKFFERDPRYDWKVLCRTVQWARSKKKRPAKAINILGMVPYAFEDGAIPELDPIQVKDSSLETKIAEALDQETDPKWRYRLVGARGIQARKDVYEAWMTQRSITSPV